MHRSDPLQIGPAKKQRTLHKKYTLCIYTKDMYGPARTRGCRFCEKLHGLRGIVQTAAFLDAYTNRVVRFFIQFLLTICILRV